MKIDKHTNVKVSLKIKKRIWNTRVFVSECTPCHHLMSNYSFCQISWIKFGTGQWLQRSTKRWWRHYTLTSQRFVEGSKVTTGRFDSRKATLVVSLTFRSCLAGCSKASAKCAVAQTLYSERALQQQQQQQPLRGWITRLLSFST